MVLNMNKEDWKRLDELFSTNQEKLTKEQRGERDALFEKTREVDEHPEDWDSPCLCQLCCSYGD